LIHKLNTAAALKLCLALYYHIEPVQTPRTPLWVRIDTLFVLMSLLDLEAQNANARIRALEPLPARVRAVRINVFIHLKSKIVSDTAKCFGGDSMAAKFEKKSFDDPWEELQAMYPMAQPPFFRYVPLRESPESAQMFVKGMNELMSWAELPSLTLEEYLR
jgi:hypothetical protein